MTPCEGDCDDLDDDVYDGAAELCDGLDNDCDGVIPTNEDDGDADGWMVCAGDCDDADLEVSPAAAEQCDSLDEDCDGLVDEGCIACDRSVPTDHATIQDAIDAALDGERICVEPGTWFEQISTDGREVHLLGLAGAGGTIVDGGGVGPVLTIDSAEGPATVVEGLTITGGIAVQGGGVLVDGASPTLVGLIVAGNEAENGGGFYQDTGGATLSGCTVSDNVASENGGGIAAVAGALTIEGGLISYNVADLHGGGVEGAAADVVIEGATFHGNSAFYGGGGYLEDGSASITNVLFDENEADDWGSAGLRLRDLTAMVDGAWFEENRSTGSPGALSVSAGSGTLSNVMLLRNEGQYAGGLTLSVGDWTLDHIASIENNSTGNGGGTGLEFLAGSSAPATVALSHGLVAGNTGRSGMYIESSTDVSLTQVAIVGNSSDVNHGGGLLLSIGWTLTMSGVTITGNASGGDGGGIRSNSAPSNTLSMTACNVWGNSPENFAYTPDPTGTDGNISVDPQHVDTASPNAWDWDLHLSVTSPLIDAGDPAWTDPDGGPADIGAYGGPGADGWDLDGDGWFEWWQPGPYNSSTYPACGLDCDDLDPLLSPPSGC